MTQTLIGLFLLLLPFSAVLCFHDRVKGFFAVFAMSAAFQLLAAGALESIHALSYGTAFAASFVFAAACLAFAVIRGKGKAKPLRIGWFAPVLFLIIISFLVSVHYRYSGIVDTGQGAGEVVRSSYPYPLYSDEWIAVSLADYSIRTGSLPFVNPLNADQPSLDFLAGFHVLVTELLLILGLSPLTHYVWLAIANGALISLFIFILLRFCGASPFAAAIAAATIPFITESGNLPGIWYLLPYSLSITFLLSAMIGFLLESDLVLYLSLLLSLVVYPPIAVFALPALLGMYLSKQGAALRKKWRKGGAVILGAAAIVVLAACASYGPAAIASRAVSLIERPSLNGGIISFLPWDIVPVFILPFAILGIVLVFWKKMRLFSFPIAVGAALWLFYAVVSVVIVIEPSRVVSVTAMLSVAVAAFGIDTAAAFLIKKYPKLSTASARGSTKILALAFLLVFAVFATSILPWPATVLRIPNAEGAMVYVPSPPVTRYLSPDDLALFAGISRERFIAPPWKGLTIGVATGNFPLESKAATLTNVILRYADFEQASCAAKTGYALKYRIAYAYSAPFSCPGFVSVGKGESGLSLYKFEK